MTKRKAKFRRSMRKKEASEYRSGRMLGSWWRFNYGGGVSRPTGKDRKGKFHV